MEVAIRAELDAEVELVRGGGGIFDVHVAADTDADGQRVFSKQDVGRFPENEEVLEQLRSLVGA